MSQVPAAESGLQIPAGRIKMYSYEEVLDQIENGRRFGNRPGVEITGIMLKKMGQPKNGLPFIHGNQRKRIGLCIPDISFPGSRIKSRNIYFPTPDQF